MVNVEWVSNNKHKNRAILIKTAIRKYVILILSNLIKEDVSMGDANIIQKVLTYIEDHIEEELSLDKIASELNYSKFYMARNFAERTGCTIYKYIQGRRLTLAAQKLVETNEPIVEIAYEAHYSSQQAFTQAFHRVYQCSPQVYRKNGIFYPVQMQIVLWTTQRLFVKDYTIGGKMAA